MGGREGNRETGRAGSRIEKEREGGRGGREWREGGREIILMEEGVGDVTS